jgi:hypothetical protein
MRTLKKGRLEYKTKFCIYFLKMMVSLITTQLLLSLFLLAAAGQLFEDKCRVHGGLWSCSDCDKCTDVGCTYEEAQWRAGYYCNGWPFFNRLPPVEAAFFLPVESKNIYCDLSANSTCLRKRLFSLFCCSIFPFLIYILCFRVS